MSLLFFDFQCPSGKRNLDLASPLGIEGAPAFVVGGKMVPGAVGLAALRDLSCRGA